MKPYQVLLLQVIIDQGAMAMKRYFTFPQSSSIPGAPPLDGLVSYPDHLLGESHSLAEMQSVYSPTPAEWVAKILTKKIMSYIFNDNPLTTSE